MQSFAPAFRISPKRWAFLSVILLVVCAAWIGYTAPPPGTTTGGKIPAPRQGFLAPDFTLLDAQGNSIQLSALRGQPVLVNFWASWCPPCQEEMPAMQRVHEDYSAQGLVILGVNTTDQDNEQAVLGFIADHQLTFPVVFDRRGEAGRLYEIRALPTSFFIDADGVIQEVLVGMPMAEALLRTQAERLLKKGLLNESPFEESLPEGSWFENRALALRSFKGTP